MGLIACLWGIAVPLAAAQLPESHPQAELNLGSKWVNQAQTLYQTGQFAAAAEAWHRAATEFATQGDPLNQAVALGNLALTAQQLGQWPKATTSINLGLQILQKQPQNPNQQAILASSLDIQGQLQLALGHPELALKIWEKAHQSYLAVGNQSGATTSLINQAQALQDVGLYPRACEILLGILSLPNQSCDLAAPALSNPLISLKLQALAYLSLGNVLRIMGSPEQSYQILQKGLEVAQTQNNSDNLTAIYLSMGNTIRALGNQIELERHKHRDTIPTPAPVRACLAPIDIEHNTAQVLYQQAANCYQLASVDTSPTGQIQAQLNLLHLWIRNQQWSQTPALIAQLQAQLARLSPSKTAITSRLKLAQNLICLRSSLSPPPAQSPSPILQSCLSPSPAKATGQNLDLLLTQIPDWSQIQELVQQALQQAQSLPDPQSEANVLGYLAAIAQQQGKLAEAQHLTEQALQRTSAFDHPELAYVWRWQLGRLYQQQGDTDAAISAYAATFEILQSLRQELVTATRDVQFTFRDSVEPVYRELVALLLQSPRPNPKQLQQARDILEALQLAELNNFFKEACFQSRRTSIDKIDPHSTVLYSVILPDRLGLIVSFPGEPLTFYATPLKSQSQSDATQLIETTVRSLRRTLDPVYPTLKPHQQLYDWLIRPVEADLIRRQTKTLVFILDGALRQVPLSALHDGQKYLVEKYSVAVTPGMQLFNSSPFPHKPLKTLAGGLGAARQGFFELPGVIKEIQGIAQIVPAQVLLDNEFTRSRIQNQLLAASFSIIHLATHGQFSSRAKDTFLLTWDEQINVKQLGALFPERHQNAQNLVELLILSACQTASGDQRSALGLAGIAVRSGARSTLGTIWSVKDASTAEFILQFYRALVQPGVTKAEALQQAQLALLHNPKYQHPVYWGAFVLIGNWL